jgi:hypothetical protein
MGLVPGSNKADNISGKTKVTGTIQWGSTVYVLQYGWIFSTVN